MLIHSWKTTKNLKRIAQRRSGPQNNFAPALWQVLGVSRGAKCSYSPLYFSITKFLSSPHHPSQRFSLFPSSLFSVLNPTFHQVHAQDCPALCNILDFLPCSSAHGMFQARILQCLAIFSSRGSSQPRDQTQVCFVSCVASRFFTCGVTAAAAAKLLQSCPTLCDPMDCSLPGSPVPGILQAGTLEWVAISFSNAWKWKVKVKSLSRVQLCATPWTAAQPARLPRPSRQGHWSGLPRSSIHLSVFRLMRVLF